MTDAMIRRAVDAAVRENGKPLADVAPDEVEELYARTIFHLIVQNAERGRKVVLR